MNNFHVASGGFNTKMSFFTPKGDGRDTYISFNNGGIWKKNNTDRMESAQYFKSPKYITPKKPNIPAKNVHYPPDGSGRDVFIKFDEGGILPTTSSPHYKNYIISLRSYSKSSYGARPDIPDFFMESQRALTFKDYIKVHRSVKVQKDLLRRLLIRPEHKLPIIKKTQDRNQTGLPKNKVSF